MSSLLFSCQNCHQISDGHRHPLLEWISGAGTFMHHDANQGIVIAGLYLCFANPLR